VENEAIQLGLWDTSGLHHSANLMIRCSFLGSADFNELRPLSYPGTDAFIVCFSIIDPKSLKEVKDKWHAEIRAHCPTSPIILVGTKLDLRGKADVIANLKKNGMHFYSLCEFLILLFFVLLFFYSLFFYSCL
jgi:small GTP-binding protein